MSSSRKHAMSDQERLELAAKLDKDLDQFIGSLEKKRYTEGWPEDRWEEEMAKHPFFSRKAPEPGEELSPLMEGLQQLKYDPEENTAQELAEAYKDDGKFYMQHKQFRMAVLSYTEALNFKVSDAEYRAVLYNNRSAANFFIKNYRSAMLDAQKAIKLKPNYSKARWRVAQCASLLDKLELCVETCDEILKNEPMNTQALELRKIVLSKKAKTERDARKASQIHRKKIDELEKTREQLRQRGVKFEEKDALTNEERLKPKLLPLENFMVKADSNGVLHWPTVFCYPQFLSTDFQQQLSEECTMEEVLLNLFEQPLELDEDSTYVPHKLNVYYENRIAGSVRKIDVRKTIKEILKEKTFFVYDGTLTFFILPKGSIHETEFLNQKRIPLRLAEGL
ncbi:DNA polymerase interacting tetratricopeptide repeat-containing, protein of 47 kDa [Toxorhynchites rutilus septentrionalis]|uniref:DNA polymerase interacting tetratricopeptide repeat-containing, protein of 47 kDa n=1 Tax=Toxorhynchites rutilus septentrionalis TaxID=329112 RepID=UPI00247905CD|nr:DNA polymerase interacting tetratricopeptide repeat-containing, protein of 47 kDa [Toxorhynchites rutilus septentrionalis]